MPVSVRSRRRRGFAVLVLVLSALCGAFLMASSRPVGIPPQQAPAAPVPIPSPAPAGPGVPWMTAGDTGLVFVSVKAEQTVAFEAGIAALKDVLIASPNPTRQAQRAGWRVFRQVEPWRAGVVYLFLLSPAVPGADYSVSTMLAEGLPDDVTVRPAYVASLMGQQSLLDCGLMMDLGEGLPLAEQILLDEAVPAPPPPSASAARDARTFTGDLGLVVMAIKAERLADFEATMARLKTALAASPDPVRQRQARSWRVLKPTNSADAETVTVAFVMDAPVPGADYAVSRILSDAFPAETGELFKNYRNVFATEGATLLNYTLVTDFRQ